MGLLTARNGGGGGGSGRAQSSRWWQLFVSWMSHTHTHTTDKRPCQTPAASSTPVQIHIETNIFNLFLIYKKKKKTHGNAYISIFHTANNQTSDHYLISIYYSGIRNCHPVQSQTFLEFNSYQKYSLCGHNLRTLMTANKHWSLLLGRELTTVLIAIKKQDSFYKTGSTEHNANNKFNPLLLKNSPLNPKDRDGYPIYLILNNMWQSVECLI